jgi:hypothetical protein
MLKTLMLATSVLAVGATGALAEGNKYNKAAGGAYYPHQQMQQPMNEQAQAILPPQNYNAMRGNGSTFIVDEYGRHYNERGDRVR